MAVIAPTDEGRHKMVRRDLGRRKACPYRMNIGEAAGAAAHIATLTGRAAIYKCVGGNVSRYDRASANQSKRPDGHAADDDRTGTN